MLQIDKVQLIEGVTVYGDDGSFNTFYLLPQQPRYRRDENGNPVFKFIKYRFPVDREDGKKGGGFIIFDAEFVVSEEKVPKIKEVLQSQVRQEANRLNISPVPDVKLGTINYTEGETILNILNENEDLVEKVFNPGVPSLYGNNITAMSAELTPEGATLCEQALQGKGGLVQVVYKLKFWAKLPPMKVNAWFNSFQFYSFFQTIDVEWRVWREDDYRETVREQMIGSESMGVAIDSGGITDEKLKSEVRDWAFRTLEGRVENMMIKQLTQVPDDQRDLPDGIENVTRDISKTSISSFNLNYEENATEEWDVNPQGTLPNITNLRDKDGNPLKWKSFATEVDLDDPFFRQLRVDTYVNADFENLPIHSVEVKLLYNGRPMANLEEGPEGEVVLRKPEDVGHFATFVENDNWKYTYSYQVNYEGTSQAFQSEEIETDEGTLTVGVDDVGILSVEVSAGDLNWNEVESAQVKLTYEDPGEGVSPLEDQFVLNEDNLTHEFQRVIFKPFRKPYKYRVKYFMKNGREFETDEREGRAHNLFINDPFAGTKTIKVLAAGDLQNTINNVFVDLKYRDEQNDYTQKHSVALNASTPFVDWVFPVISETLGEATYSGNVMLKDGTVRPIEQTIAEANTIIVPKPPVDHLKVDVVTDLLDFSTVKLVRLSVSYEDETNFASKRRDFIFSANNGVSQAWEIPIFDPAKDSYSWEATYFMSDNSQKKIGPTETSEPTIILEVPV